MVVDLVVLGRPPMDLVLVATGCDISPRVNTRCGLDLVDTWKEYTKVSNGYSSSIA